MSVTRPIRAAGAFAVVLLCLNVGADTSLVKDNFQDPLVADNTASPAFAGWTYVNGNQVKSRLSTVLSAVPGDDNFDPNQIMHLEYTTGLARYTLTHEWSTTDVFTLTVNAAPSAWAIDKARWIRPKIRQNSDHTVLWDPGDTAETKQGEVGQWAWNGPGPYGNSTWQAEPDTTSLGLDDACQRRAEVCRLGQ